MPVYAAPPTGNKTVLVKGVNLNVETLTLEVGNSQTLYEIVSPINATNKTVAWSSNNTSVAKVDSYGAVTAIAAGTAIITVTTASRGLTDTCVVTVKNPLPIVVTGITLNVETLTLEVGNTQTLTTTVLPDNATNKAVAWSSDDPLVATVNSSGGVTAIAVGIATITATTNGGEFTDTCNVTVNPSSTIHYLALGDSIATGTTSRGDTTSYIDGFYEYLKIKYPLNTVTTTDLSNDGDASAELLYKLKTNLTFQEEVKKANIITISIGGNNILSAGKNYFSSIDNTIAQAGTLAFEIEYDQIIVEIRRLNTTAKIVAATLYNPYNSVSISGYSGDPMLHEQVQPYIGRINAKIKGVINDPSYTIADVYSSFLNYANQGKMGSITYFYPTSFFKFTRDPHPNQTGQNLIRDIHKGISFLN